jgi:hypothetical protein
MPRGCLFALRLFQSAEQAVSRALQRRAADFLRAPMLCSAQYAKRVQNSSGYNQILCPRRSPLVETRLILKGSMDLEDLLRAVRDRYDIKVPLISIKPATPIHYRRLFPDNVLVSSVTHSRRLAERISHAAQQAI